MFSLAARTRRRRTALIALLAFSILTSGPFFVLHRQAGAMPLAIGSLLVGLGSVALLLALRRRERLTPYALIYVLMLASAVALALTYPARTLTAHAWAPAIPVVCYLLLPRRLAFWVTVIFLGEFGAAYLYGAYRIADYLNPLAMANVAAPILGLFVFCHFYSRNLARTESTLRQQALRDPLTGLGNRGQLAEDFEQEQRLAAQDGRPLSVVLIDLDHFKRVNDSYGHDAGDAALVFVAKLLKKRLRQADRLARLGGEEFAVLLPSTAKAGAMKVAEELRSALSQQPFSYRAHAIGLTLSAGVVEYGRDGTSWRELYRAADSRLYACKAQGRNCVLGALP